MQIIHRTKNRLSNYTESADLTNMALNTHSISGHFDLDMFTSPYIHYNPSPKKLNQLLRAGIKEMQEFRDNGVIDGEQYDEIIELLIKYYLGKMITASLDNNLRIVLKSSRT